MKKLHDQKECQVVKALAIIGGKWKLPLIKRLTGSTKRYNELFRELEGVTQRMLTKQLRELEIDKIVARKVYSEIPPKVEYSLTKAGKELHTVILELEKWGKKHTAHR